MEPYSNTHECMTFWMVGRDHSMWWSSRLTGWIVWLPYSSCPPSNVVPSPIVALAERSFLGLVPNPAAVSNLLSLCGMTKTLGKRFTNTLHMIYGSWLFWNNKRMLWQSDPRPFDAMALVTWSDRHWLSACCTSSPSLLGHWQQTYTFVSW